jgi:hypothetical protein
MTIEILNCIGRQGYENAYYAQRYPVIGIVPSAATAVATLVTGIAKAVLATLYPEHKYYNSYAHREMSYKEDAQDLTRLFLNNVLNICTLGFWNSDLVQCAGQLEHLDTFNDAILKILPHLKNRVEPPKKAVEQLRSTLTTQHPFLSHFARVRNQQPQEP